MNKNKYLRKMKKKLGGILAGFLFVSVCSPHVPTFEVLGKQERKPGETMLSESPEWDLFCIDSYELLKEAGGVLGANEWYAYVIPSTRMSREDVAILFWSMLSMKAGKGDETCITAIKKIQEEAPRQGLETIGRFVTEEDIKTILHRSATRNKYSWLGEILAHEELYLGMAGLLGRSGSGTVGGKQIPTVLQNHRELTTALSVDSNTYTIQFDESGSDKEFIQTVPIQFSLTGEEPWESSSIAGWTYEKTDASVIFSNSKAVPPKLWIRFQTQGTDYQVGGGYASMEQIYDTALQLWVCIECNNRHVQHSQKKLPLEAHQRLADLSITLINENYYATIGGGLGSDNSGDLNFRIYRHKEEMKSTYNLQLYKYDHETGMPLEQSIFKLYERFDDKDQINTKKDGPEHLYEGGLPYKSYHKDNPVIWDNFKFVSGLSTDENGYASKTINHEYYYDKTFCDGHPAPAFVSVPWEEEDPETGEIINEEEVVQAQEENLGLAQAWYDCVDACEEYSTGEFYGVHFHWRMTEVNQGVMDQVLATGGAEGETPNGGRVTSKSGEESFKQSGCTDDARETYQTFISLKYSYALVEATARPGYILHGIHGEDLPIEVITTDSSQNGGNAFFGGIYGHEIIINDFIQPEVVTTQLIGRKQTESNALSIDKERLEAPYLTKAPSPYKQPVILLASSSNRIATPSNDFEEITFRRTNWNGVTQSSNGNDSSQGGTSMLFTDAYTTALTSFPVGDNCVLGSEDRYSHCNHQDGEGNAWRVYDHRTQGEIHINKKDMDLQAGESEDYNSYGDTQGDGSLEGAVYGLFAAADLIHPDGKTGVVYAANDLVSVATTDQDGNASFLVNTEGPGYGYDYKAGEILKWENGWADLAPKNLYTKEMEYDEYTQDGAYARIYPDYETLNGNSWIGRPLLMGDYYVKELSRSEGYELSIGNRDNTLTNRGQNHEITVPKGVGYASVTRNFFAEGQISSDPTGEYGNPDINELFFTAESKGIGTAGFDIGLPYIPEGAKCYRLDTGSKTQEVQVGTGVFRKEYLTKEDGTPKYVQVEYHGQYPKYNDDGSLMTEKQSVNLNIQQIPRISEKPLSPMKTKNAIEAEESLMTQTEVLELLEEDFSVERELFLKGKIERALRANGKNTPKIIQGSTWGYSNIYYGVYDRGVRQGEIDSHGISNVMPGEPAKETVYGSPVMVLEIPKVDETGTPIKLGDVILSILDFYNTHAFYSYGGIDSVEERADQYLITVYASVSGNPANFMVPGSDPITHSVIYHRVSFMPDNLVQTPVFLYATYSNNKANDSFGSYEDYKEILLGSRMFASATLVTDAVADGRGNLQSKTISENMYYKKGEIPLDALGNLIQAYEYREETTTEIQEVEVKHWTELQMNDLNGVSYVHVDTDYTDFYGVAHQDKNLQSYQLRILLPEKEVELTQWDIDQIKPSTDWVSGERMGSAAYYLHIKGASGTAYLNYKDQSLVGDRSFVGLIQLRYPGQKNIWQDGPFTPGSNTRQTPLGVEERVIRQKIKVEKKIDVTEEGGYDNSTYQEIHKDWLAEYIEKGNAMRLDNFRFKLYLKSNLERLYRDKEGKVYWEDSKGKSVDIKAFRGNFPERVQKIYTRKTSIPILETYNYKKFFHAVWVANRDKWEHLTNQGIEFIDWKSWKPQYGTIHLFAKTFRNEGNTSSEAVENAKSSDEITQFAILWYLEHEVQLLVANSQVETSYPDEIYDQALYQALKKATDYLTPFFRYNMDEIYGIQWDGEIDGGKDLDATTLNVDILEGSIEDGTYFGISQYLPYGTYVSVEQQPYNNIEGKYDFYNKHYRIHDPKEIVLPSLNKEEENPREIPWTVIEPLIPNDYHQNNFVGYADHMFSNTYYTTKLRIEKVDRETGENILHDQGIFAIYAASRTDEKTGKGQVKFYETPTVITGSKEFLEAMGGVEIHPLARDILSPELKKDILWYGTVPPGTPVCLETEQVVMSENWAFSTMREGEMLEENGNGTVVGNQTTGYFETPQPLGAGVYVLVEIKPPAGYRRSKPIAIEIYSDQVRYYQNGNPKEPVRAGIYKGDTARIFVGNAPTGLEVEKKKTEADTVTYPLSGRVEGGISQLMDSFGKENLELAYASSNYLGYGWKKGMLETLRGRQEAGQSVEILYEKGVFSGVGMVTQPLLTTEESNAYVPGATMILYDAISVRPNGDSQDFAYDGVVVQRDSNNNVTRMYVKEGYAGEKIQYVCKGEHEEGRKIHQGTCVWTYETKWREDTDILYYSLGNLKVFQEKADGSVYSYDQAGVSMKIGKGVTTSIFATRYDRPEFELVCDSFDDVVYEESENAFLQVPVNGILYHLDANGNRDAIVDPYTGMAFTLETQNQGTGSKLLVWPVQIIKSSFGTVLASNKIKTARIATIHADTTQEYIGGTYDSEKKTFAKKRKPVLDQSGQVVYYKQSKEEYQKSQAVYDRDQTFVYNQYADELSMWNKNAYIIKKEKATESLFMRQGDHYILENTWISGDSTPNDPFHTFPTSGQRDVLKRVIPGTYILEELQAPTGYTKAMPIGVLVDERSSVGEYQMTDETIKVELSKVDRPENHKILIQDYDKLHQSKEGLEGDEGKLAFTYHFVPGANLHLYYAEKIYTTETERYPDGWYWKKGEPTPYGWITKQKPMWIERIPKGTYLLEETMGPDGYVRGSMPLEIKETGRVQTFQLANDHTKLELFKYQEINGKKNPLSNENPAELRLYECSVDENGIPHYSEANLMDQWETNDCTPYTNLVDLSVYEKWGIWKGWFKPTVERYSGFQHDYELMYNEYGGEFDTLHWYYTDTVYGGIGDYPPLREGMASLVETIEIDGKKCIRQVWETKEGNQIRIGVSSRGDQNGKLSYEFEYQYNYKDLINNGVSYDKSDGSHRIDYLKWDTAYVLVETKTPEGFETAMPKVIHLRETRDVQLYGMENKKIQTEPELPPVETIPEETTSEVREEETTIPPTLPEWTTEPEGTISPSESSSLEPTRPTWPDEEREERSEPPAKEVPHTKATGKGRISAIYMADQPIALGFVDWSRNLLGKTGDYFPLWLWMAVFFISGIGLFILKRRGSSETKYKNTTNASLDHDHINSNDSSKMSGGKG